jgi:hypothetical protein
VQDWPVIHNSFRRGRPAIESLKIFADGLSVDFHLFATDLSDQVILKNFEQCRDKRYNVFTYNCEHFVNEVTGKKIESPQLALAAVVGGLSLLVGLLSSRS